MDLQAALTAVLAEVAETLEHHGSLAPTAYVLPDWHGEQLTILSLAANSEKNRELSIARVRATVAEKAAVAVVWAMDTWEADPATGRRRAVVKAELQTRGGDWYRLLAPIAADDLGQAMIATDEALASLETASDRSPLFAAAFA